MVGPRRCKPIEVQTRNGAASLAGNSKRLARVYHAVEMLRAVDTHHLDAH